MIQYHNFEGAVVFIVAMTVGMVTYFGFSPFLGDSRILQCFAWCLAGLITLAPDVYSFFAKEEPEFPCLAAGPVVGLGYERGVSAYFFSQEESSFFSQQNRIAAIAMLFVEESYGST